MRPYFSIHCSWLILMVYPIFCAKIDPLIHSSNPENRFQFFTYSINLFTSTTYSTFTMSTYCTTSTTALGICVPIGKRSVLLARYPGLLYNENVHDNVEFNIDAFLRDHQSVMGREDDQQENVPVTRNKDTADNNNVFIPFVPQSGIETPDGLPLGRFLLSFGTTTTTLTTTTTYTSKLTATCLSTTPFQLCGVTGK